MGVYLNDYRGRRCVYYDRTCYVGKNIIGAAFVNFGLPDGYLLSCNREKEVK